MKKSFSKKHRLVKSVQFQRVIRHGKVFEGKFIVAHLVLGKGNVPKLGLTVSKRFGASSRRSRFKRLVREAFRTSLDILPPALEIHVRPKIALHRFKMQEIQQELLSSAQYVSSSSPQ